MIGEDEMITVFSYTQRNQLLQHTNKCFINDVKITNLYIYIKPKLLKL